MKKNKCEIAFICTTNPDNTDTYCIYCDLINNNKTTCKHSCNFGNNLFGCTSKEAKNEAMKGFKIKNG